LSSVIGNKGVWGRTSKRTQFIDPKSSGEVSTFTTKFIWLGPKITNLKLSPAVDQMLAGVFEVTFREFLQKDCQDLLLEDQHSGNINFVLNPVTGEITFSAVQYPVREYDPEEF
jgi:hypothetical protein